MKKLSLLLTSLLIATGCSSENTSTSTNSQNINKPSSLETIIKSPNEDGGLEGNQDQDEVILQDAAILKDFLLQCADVTSFTYEITSKVNGSENNFTQYFTENAWYEDNGDLSNSFGYALEKDTNYVFKYYLDENNQEIIPSIYQYEGYNDEITNIKDLYGPFYVSHINILKYSMDDFSAVTSGQNRFLITDTNTASVFQFLTSYGNSITDYIISTTIDVLDFDDLIFRATIDLGVYGSIEGLFTPTNNHKITSVDQKVKAGEVKGIEYHEDVNTFLSEKVVTNNYVLHGVKQKNSLGQEVVYPYDIHCTNDYFYLEYNPEFLAMLDPASRATCVNFGMAMIEKDTPVTYYETQYDGSVIEKTQTLAYTTCYGFTKDKNGEFYFDSFIGPLETNGLKYKEVDTLPSVGEEDTLYIIEEDGVKNAYEYREVEDGVYGFALYSTWVNSVGDFPINGVLASFYLGCSALPLVGSLYFEKSLTNENEYFSNDVTIMGVLANGLFGWGFQATDTWMSYIENSRIRVNKDSNGNIESYDVILDVLAKLNGSDLGLQEVYYTVDSFNEGDLDYVQTFLDETLGGAN